MVCPYKATVLLLTVVFAALVSSGLTTQDESVTAEDKKRKAKKWSERSLAYRGCYILCAALLLLGHFELFTGGSICRYLFAKSNSTAVESAPEPIAAAA